MYGLSHNISDVSLCLSNYSFPVDFHYSTCTPPWFVDAVGDMVAERIADLFGSAPYVYSFFAGDAEKKM